MGNQMFQYALGRALSIKHRVPLKLDTTFLLDRTQRPGMTFRDYELGVFSIDAAFATKKEIPFLHRMHGGGMIAIVLDKLRRKVFPSKGTERGTAFNPDILSVGPHVYLEGYWQSHKYFDAYSDQIKKDLTIKQPLPKHIRTLQSEIGACTSACMHVRRGDYIGNPYHDVVGIEYYQSALVVVKERTTIDHLYIFSNDAAWCTDNLKFDVPTTVVGDEYAGERQIGHFALMQACTHFIIANSSFSWWAAWLGQSAGSVVIAPKQWFGDDAIDTSSRIPDNWIQI